MYYDLYLNESRLFGYFTHPLLIIKNNRESQFILYARVCHAFKSLIHAYLFYFYIVCVSAFTVWEREREREFVFLCMFFCVHAATHEMQLDRVIYYCITALQRCKLRCDSTCLCKTRTKSVITYHSSVELPLSQTHISVRCFSCFVSSSVSLLLQLLLTLFHKCSCYI